MKTDDAQKESAERKQLRASGTKSGLYVIMSAIRDVRSRAAGTDEMFSSMNNTVGLLQKYGIQVTTFGLLVYVEIPKSFICHLFQ